MTNKPKWLTQPEEHDYVAAVNYLTLVLKGTKPKLLATQLKKAKIQEFAVKDILRASQLEHLPVENKHVANDLRKVKNKEKLSPILLVRGDATKGLPLTIADGYHRACAALHLDENVLVPCKLVDLQN